MSPIKVKPPTQYSGSLVFFLENYVRPNLPPVEKLLEANTQLVNYCLNPDNLLILKKFGSFSKRGSLYQNQLAHTKFTVSDGEAPLWLFLNTFSQLEFNLKHAIDQQRIPVAFSMTKKESDPPWRSIGREDSNFSAYGWKLGQLMPPLKKGDVPKTREQYLLMFYRFLSPMNQFPFPSPWKFEMEKDWGKETEILNVVFSWLWHKFYPTESYPEFTAFLKLIESDFPFQDPIDTTFSYLSRAHPLSLPEVTEGKIYDNEISSDENIHSIPKDYEAANIQQFNNILINWYLNTDEETVGNVGSNGRVPWLSCQTNIGKIQLSGDSPRLGVKKYLDMVDKDKGKLELHSCPSKSGGNIVAFGPYKKTIAKFNLEVL